MADDNQPWWEKLGGMVGSALKSPTTYQNLVGLAVGGLGGREAALDYMAPIEAQRQHKALQQLAINMGVIQPGQNLPPGLDDPKEFRKLIEPKRKYDKTGYWEERYGQEPKRVTTGDVAEKLPTNEEWTTAQDLYFKTTGKVPQSRADVFPYIEQAQQINRQNKLDQAAAMTGQKPIHVPGVGFVTPGVTGSGPKVVPIPGEQPKGPKKVGEVANKKYVDATGRPAPAEMTEGEAVLNGYRAIDLPTFRQFPSFRQSMKILENISTTIDRLNKKDKLVQWKGDEGRLDYQIDALGQVVNLKWRKLARDPDLRLAQAQTSQMISAMRNLGDKGVRAIQAFEGAMGLMEAGAAPYSTIRDFLQMLDSEMREVVSEDVPQLLDRYPGARNLPPPAPTDEELFQQSQ